MSVWLRDRCLGLMREAIQDYAIQNGGGPEIPAAPSVFPWTQAGLM